MCDWTGSREASASKKDDLGSNIAETLAHVTFAEVTIVTSTKKDW